MSKLFLIFFIIFVIAAMLTTILQKGDAPYNDAVVKFKYKKVFVEIADNITTQAQGLSNRESLGENQGMLFVYDEAKIHRFWMKDMLIPLDIIWISGNKVVDMNQKAQVEEGVADRDLIFYSPSEPADKVLELNAGWAERNGLNVGDTLEIDLD
jgi:uncharacterized protein